MKSIFHFKIIKSSVYNDLKVHHIKNENIIEKATTFIKEIEKGNGNDFPDNSNNLIAALRNMRDKIKKIGEQEAKRNWAIQGLAKFAGVLRTNNNDLKALSEQIISDLVKYINVNQGAIFIYNDDKENSFLELLSCYAYCSKRFLPNKIEPGEGLVGQAFLEKQTIYLKNIPEGYMNITSGLGEGMPKNILIVPLKSNGKIYGVVELASLTHIQSYQIDFVEKLGEGIAFTISNFKANQNIEKLLFEFKKQTDEMRITQKELARKSKELGKNVAEFKSILKGIKTVMATIEFTPKGIIKDANDIFVRTMKCTKKDFVGKHHQIFVPQQILETVGYKEFWTSLAQGNAKSGTFKRQNMKGEVVWFNANYTPVFDENGKVLKVVKFASVITTEKEK